MKLIKKLASAFLAMITLLPINVMAEGSNEEKGKITIKYYDDSDQKVPVPNSTWMLFKVGDVYTTSDSEGTNVDALHIESLIPDFEIKGLGHDEPTTADEVLNLLDYTIVNDSEWIVRSRTKDGTSLKSWTRTTDKNGVLSFDELPYGVYLGVETKAERYHVLTSPFLISIPYTREDEKNDNQAVSQIEVTIEPKAVVAGDLEITKKTYGDGVESEAWFNMTVTFPQGGHYYYETSRGRKGTIDKQAVIGIKAYETITVYNVPGGAFYTVEEAEANQNGYRTWYTDNEGRIDAKDTVECFVHNERYKKDVPPNDKVNTGTGSMLLVSGVAMITAGAALVCLLKHKKEEDEDE